MAAPKSCSVRIMNKDYEVKCLDGEIENLQQAADTLNQELLHHKKKFKQLGEFPLLLLAALHLSHKLVICQQQQEQQRDQVNQFINSLENKIHQVVHGNLTQDPQTD